MVLEVLWLNFQRKLVSYFCEMPAIARLTQMGQQTANPVVVAPHCCTTYAYENVKLVGDLAPSQKNADWP